MVPDPCRALPNAPDPAKTYAPATDWPWLCRYAAADAVIASGPRPKAVFMGDSITEGWAERDPSFFTNGVVDRGISGQTSPQMLARFYQDVVALKPEVVHIMCGTNDLAGNTGVNSVTDYENNIRAMVDLAQAHGIKVVLASIPPVRKFPWQPTLEPAAQVAELNAWLRAYAAERRATFVDYFDALATSDGDMKPELAFDGVHPTPAGYAVMRPMAEAAITAALQSHEHAGAVRHRRRRS